MEIYVRALCVHASHLWRAHQNITMVTWQYYQSTTGGYSIAVQCASIHHFNQNVHP